MIKYFTEIKNRFLLILTTYFFNITTIYFYKEIILFLIIQSKNQYESKNVSYFIFTDVTEIFSVYIKLLFFISSQLLFFYVLYNIFIFLIPAFYKKEYIYFKFIFKLFCFTWFFSSVVSIQLLIPLTWNFFLSFQESMLSTTLLNIHFEAKLIEYLNFFIYFYFMSTLYLQLNIFSFGLFNYFNVSLTNIKKFRKVYYLSLVFSTTFLCPEIFSQIFIISIILIAYESLVLFFLLIKKFS